MEGISSITLADIDAAAELGYRVKLLGVAVRTDAGIEQRVHPTMVPKVRDRAGDGRDQRSDGRRRRPFADHLVGPVPAAWRPRPPSCRSGELRAACERRRWATCRARWRCARRSCSATRRLLHPADGTRPPGQRGHHRAAAGAAANLAQSIVQRHETCSQDAGKSGDPVPVILITYATTEDAVHRRSPRCAATVVIPEGHRSSGSKRTRYYAGA